MGNPCVEGASSGVGVVSCPADASGRVTAVCTDGGDGTHTITWHCEVAGSYLVRVLI